ncbi:MAG: hypothetical protein RLZZ09_314, partial [Pseudomonadota bacterium]
MNAHSKNLTRIAAALMLAMACGTTMADNVIDLEQAGTNNGTGNYANITATGSGANAVSIYQAGNGTGASAAERNQVGTSTAGQSLNITGTGGVVAKIGQGGYNDGSWNASRATKGNIVKGTLSTGAQVTTSQNASGDGTGQNVIDLNITGAGQVTVNQGQASGTPTSASATHFSATVRRDAAGGAITINQGNAASSTAVAGIANVRHAGGTHSVSVTQTDGTNTDMGTVETYTTGDGGSLTITQSNAGKTYVTSTGATGGGAATISGTAVLNNSGTGTVGLKGVTTGNVVDVYAKGTGTLTVDNQLGSGNGVYANTAGTKIGGSVAN